MPPKADFKRIATCCSCGAPLIGTMAFRKFEYYCLECGRKYGLIEPYLKDPTPELLEQYRKLLEEWREITADNLIIENGQWIGCAKCQGTREPHRSHATND